MEKNSGLVLLSRVEGKCIKNINISKAAFSLNASGYY